MKNPRRFLSGMALCACAMLTPQLPAAPHNYAEALQKSQFFFDVQQSGAQPSDSLVEWRGPSHLNDGSDLGKNLTGGWYDAGDFWKSNMTMAYAAVQLSWSYTDTPDAYANATLRNNHIRQLRDLAAYLKACVLDANPTGTTNFSNYRVVIDIGGSHTGRPTPDSHSFWAAAETGDALGEIRPSYYVNTVTPGSDSTAAMSAALAAVAEALHRSGDTTGSAALIPVAEKLWRFANAYRTPMKIRDASNTLVNNPAHGLAIRGTDGAVVTTGYRGKTGERLFTAAAWLARLHDARGDTTARDAWINSATTIRDSGLLTDENSVGWYSHVDWYNWYYLGAHAMARLTGASRYHQELQNVLSGFSFDGGDGDWKTTPGGLRYRPNLRDSFLLQTVAGNTALALHYSDLVASAPSVAYWFNGSRTKDQLRDAYRSRAYSNINYVLGDNPKGKPYMLGYTNAANGAALASWPIVHHRTAHGVWAGNLHKITGNPEYNLTARHLLHGGVLTGPNYEDKYTELADYSIDKVGYTEVALAVNGPWQNALAWCVARGLSSGGLLSNFPAPETRNTNLDSITTDREFFVEARRVGTATNPLRLNLRLNNRSRWPATVTDQLSFRYYFTLESGVSLSQISTTVHTANGATVTLVSAGGGLAYANVSFGSKIFMPARRDFASPSTRYDRVEVEFSLTPASGAAWNLSNDWSASGLTETLAIRPRIPVYRAGALVEGEAPDVLDGIAGRWNANDGSGTTLAVSAGSAGSGTLSGSPLPSWVSPGANDSGAISFNGSNAVLIPDSAALTLTGDITICLWLKPDSWPSSSWVGRSVLQKGNYGWNAVWTLGKPDSNVFRGFIRGVGTVQATTLPATGAWTHVALVYDRSIPALILYYDGVEKARTTLTSAPAASTVAQALRVGTGEGAGSFIGSLDNLRVYGRALSAAELQRVMDY